MSVEQRDDKEKKMVKRPLILLNQLNEMLNLISMCFFFFFGELNVVEKANPQNTDTLIEEDKETRQTDK